jgi:hypothetical protein
LQQANWPSATAFAAIAFYAQQECMGRERFAHLLR